MKLTRAHGLLTKLKWAVLGKPEIETRRDEAMAYGVPFEDRRFWPAFYVFDKRPLKNGAKHWVKDRSICPELYGSKLGDVVPVYSDDQHVYNYRVLGFSWASGDDHIVSPRQFHIQFAGRVALESQP